MTGAATIRSSRRMPDFAGVALVDILANGVAMLIIVIVVTIAARVEREERYAEQADEVVTVMSRKFSTSLVLNSLAASPPARLHDYDASPLDLVLDPYLLPILELHPKFVREFYSGTVWTRRELLEERNGLDAWLAGFDAERKTRIRVDVYDIPQFYLTMSILREHGIRIHHWHFLTGSLSPDEAARCPPGVAAKDCLGSGDEAPAPLPQLALEDRGSSGLGGPESPLSDPPSGAGDGSDDAGSASSPMPGGVVPGITGLAGAGFEAGGGTPGSSGSGMGSGMRSGSRPGSGTGLQPGSGTAGGAEGEAAGAEGTGRGLLSGSGAAGGDRGFGTGPGLDPGTAAILGSFPGAREGGGGSSAGTGRGGQPPRSGQNRARNRSGGDGSQISLRVALPESIRREAQSGGQGVPALETMFGVILRYLGGLQGSLDAGGTPSPQIDGFAERIQRAFQAPPQLTEAERAIARDLALKFSLLPHLGTPAFGPEPLALRSAPPEPETDAALVIEPNRLNDVVGVHRSGDGRDGRAGRDGRDGRDGEDQAAALPGGGRTTLALNAYPGIWKGLEMRIEPYSVLLMPPEVRAPERTRWRAVAYITPRLDDFIVGFVFADMDTEGRLRIQADANRVRLEGRPLFTEYRESAFGSRGWLVSLYAALAAGLLLLVVGWRYLAVRTA